MNCRKCNIEMNEQKKQKMIMKSYFICSKCLEHRIEFKNKHYLEAWLKVYPSTVLKFDFKFEPVTQEETVIYFKLIPISEVKLS